MKRIMLAVACGAALAGCNLKGVSTGGSSTGAITHQIGLGTAPYVVLDIPSRTLTYLRDVPDLVSNAAYRDSKIVFHRVGSGSEQALIGVFELTQGQWVRIDPLSSTPWDAPITSGLVPATAAGTGYPAFNLTADDLSTALVAFAIPGGSHLAIPTSAQWRTASGVSSGYTWGPVADRAHLVAQAVVRETRVSAANLAATTTQIDTGGPAMVASLSPSGKGIYDLHGNVWEWVDSGTRVKGGSWYDPASLARVDADADVGQGLTPDVDHVLIGARLVLVP